MLVERDGKKQYIVTADEILAWLRSRPGYGMDVSIGDVESAKEDLLRKWSWLNYIP